LRPVAVFEEIQRRHAEIGTGVRRTLSGAFAPGCRAT